MKIRFTTSMVGADFVRNVNDVADLPQAEAVRLIEAGYAVPMRGKATEKAIAPADDAEHAIDHG